MANGGMGDGLTGIISSLAGQNYSLYESTKIGCFLHGYIGDALLEEQYIINISHIIENIPKYMKIIFENIAPKERNFMKCLYETYKDMDFLLELFSGRLFLAAIQSRGCDYV